MEQVIALLRASKRPVVFTGAGISKESGIQTFRDADGLWKDFDLNKFATLKGFLSDPELVWRWYRERIEKIQAVSPNHAHYFVAALDAMFGGVTVVTQNIDGLHQKAGSRDVLELHGSIQTVKCTKCIRKRPMDDVDFTVLPPRCECGGMLRPDVVWFGEALPREALDRALNLAGKADLAIVIGTSCQVYPAAEMPFIVKKKGGAVIEINPEETPLSGIATVRIIKPDRAFYLDLIESIT